MDFDARCCGISVILVRIPKKETGEVMGLISINRAALYTNNRYVSFPRKSLSFILAMKTHLVLGKCLVCAAWISILWFIVSICQWLSIIPAFTNVYSAGLFWASEGAVALGYPEPTKRGKYMK